MIMRCCFSLVAFVGLMSGLASPALASIEGTAEPFVHGRTSTLVVQDDEGKRWPDRAIDVVYYPGADIAERESLGVTDARGEVRWTPRFAGLSRIEVLDEGDSPGASSVVESRVVGVRFRRVPAVGLAVFVLACALLFGGLALGVARTRHDA